MPHAISAQKSLPPPRPRLCLQLIRPVLCPSILKQPSQRRRLDHTHRAVVIPQIAAVLTIIKALNEPKLTPPPASSSSLL
jgi:hypothetical protein